MINKLFKILGLKRYEEFQLSVERSLDESFESLNADIIKMTVGEDFVEYIDTIINTVGVVRNDIKSRTGFILPLVHILSDFELQENEFNMYVREKNVLQEFVIPNEENIVESIKNALLEIFENYIDEIFSMSIVEKYLTEVQKDNSWLIWDISRQIGAYEIKSILVNIIKEKKSIANINYIFEKIDECLAENRDYFRVLKPEVISSRICKEI